MPVQTCTYTFWRAEREQGESEVIRRHSSFPLHTRAGDGARLAPIFFLQCTPDQTCTHLYGFGRGAKGGGPPTVALHRVTVVNRHRLSSAAGARRQRERALHRITTLAGRAGGRAAANPLTATRRRENSRAPPVFCHTVDIYSKKTLKAGLILHPPPVTMTSLTPYKVADAVGPDGRRLGGAVGLAT